MSSKAEVLDSLEGEGLRARGILFRAPAALQDDKDVVLAACFRGGGFDDRHRRFFVVGRKFRQPAFLATSSSEEVADRFMHRAISTAKVKWVIRIDSKRKCAHVNLVVNRVPGLPDEQEYLFTPYSAFTVMSVAWNAGTGVAPHKIELLAAADNKEEPEDLPLAPWS